MADYYTVEPPALEAFGREVFVALGAPEDIAAEVAAHLVRANLAGHDSHGAIRIPQYATMIAQGAIKPAGRPSVVRERGATMLVDATDGFGQYATAWALDRAIERAGEQGSAVVAIRRVNHIGRLGDYTERAARRGYVAEVTVGAAGPGIGGAAPFGGAARFLGTNPWSLGIPTGAEPVLVDFATTVVAEGKVRVARAKREALPPGCIVDKEGRPSTDPEDFYAGGMLLPFGGHKGYGLALGAALLGGLAAIGESEPSMAGAAGPPDRAGAGRPHGRGVHARRRSRRLRRPGGLRRLGGQRHRGLEAGAAGAGRWRGAAPRRAGGAYPAAARAGGGGPPGGHLGGDRRGGGAGGGGDARCVPALSAARPRGKGRHHLGRRGAARRARGGSRQTLGARGRGRRTAALCAAAARVRRCRSVSPRWVSDGPR